MQSNDNDRAVGARRILVTKLEGATSRESEDLLAVEEPLAIRLAYHREGKPRQRTVAVTMRTPGDDFELASGFLLSERLIGDRNDIVAIANDDPQADEEQPTSSVRVELTPEVDVDFERLERHSYMNSSCGVCGKTSLAALGIGEAPPVSSVEFEIEPDVLYRLPEVLRGMQAVFRSTGGLHAAALFDGSGELLSLREDVGRHNALDKLIGAELLANRLPLREPRILLLSGRASFELIQKAALASIPIVAAIGAPSSLAVELAGHYDITLAGFLRSGRCNVYTAPRRVKGIVSRRSGFRA